jgi:hypothetical protein
MSSLINQKIKDTYEGLIKTSDEQPIDGTLKNLQDGNGGVLPIQVSTGGVNFTGTVTGITAGGMVAGTGTDSIRSADDLTTNPANAAGDRSIAIGEGAAATAEGAVALGEDTLADGEDCVAIGRGANSNSESIAIGDGSTNASGRSVSIGRSASANGNGVAIGNFAQGSGGTAISIACSSIGGMSNAANNALMIVPGPYGGSTDSNAAGAIVLGEGTGILRATSNAVGGIAIGSNTVTDGLNSVALGAGVTANVENTVSVKALETQTDSTPTAGGIIMSDAGGTDRRINIDASGTLQIDSTPIGGGGLAAGLISGSGTDSMQSASTLTTVAANASEADTIALGDGSIASSANNIAIGNTANAGGDNAFARSNIAIGFNTDATNEKDVAVGNEAQATGSRTVAIGDSANASGSRSVVVGASSTASAFSSCVFGAFSEATAEGATVVGGYGSSATAVDAIAVGKEADATAIGAIAIGKLAQATADGAVAIGSGINAVTADTVTMDKLQILDYANINYADDTAAAAGGIPLGGVYHNAGDLKIRIV